MGSNVNSADSDFEPERPHGSLVVPVRTPLVHAGPVEGAQHRLHVQRERVQRAEPAGGAQERPRVRLGRVHVQLQHAQPRQVPGQQRQVRRGQARARPVLLVEARVVAQAERRQGRAVREHRRDGEVPHVHRHLQRRERPDVRLDEGVQPPRRLGAQVRRVVRAEVLAVQRVQARQVVEVDGAEEVVDGHRDELQRGDAGEVPAQLAEGREALVRGEVELGPLAAVLEAEDLQVPGGYEEVLKRVEARDQGRCWEGRLEGDEQVDRDGPDVDVAQLALEVPQGELLDVQPRVVVAGLLRVEHVGWHPKLVWIDLPVYISPSVFCLVRYAYIWARACGKRCSASREVIRSVKTSVL
ncbi:hypothetical protein VP1G_10988 [Cytospora mali]|uniref:Uncharacterized protein n=1 Tax=Cytospora mali TaxID=578113 RepID=A0A194UZK8_CYTMA|nr:hypothetical protein VP1G_10988 [Valsa mali var. pyri (nom. inval.)]